MNGASPGSGDYIKADPHCDLPVGLSSKAHGTSPFVFQDDQTFRRENQHPARAADATRGEVL